MLIFKTCIHTTSNICCADSNLMIPQLSKSAQPFTSYKRTWEWIYSHMTVKSHYPHFWLYPGRVKIVITKKRV